MGVRCPQPKNHFFCLRNFTNKISFDLATFFFDRGTRAEGILRLKRTSRLQILINGGLNFWGRGTFSSSGTSGQPGHTVHYQSFRGWRDDKNAFWTVSNSTSGFELWGFEIFRRSPFRGQNARNPYDFTLLETVLRVLESESKESKSYRYNFEESVLDFSKKTRLDLFFFECSLPMNSTCMGYSSRMFTYIIRACHKTFAPEVSIIIVFYWNRRLPVRQVLDLSAIFFLALVVYTGVS